MTSLEYHDWVQLLHTVSALGLEVTHANREDGVITVRVPPLKPRTRDDGWTE